MRSKKRYEQLKVRNRQTRRDVEQMRVAHGLLRDEIAALEREKARLQPPMIGGNASHLVVSTYVPADALMRFEYCWEGLESFCEDVLVRKLVREMIEMPGFVQYETSRDSNSPGVIVKAHAWCYRLISGGPLRPSLELLKKGGL